MKISVRVFLGYFLVVALAAYFVLTIFVQEVKPGVRQGMEVALVDTAHLLAEVVAPEFEGGDPGTGALSSALHRYRARNPQASIWGMAKTGTEFRVYVTDAKGMLLFDSGGDRPGADYSRWNDVLLTLRGQYGVRSSRPSPASARSMMHVAAPILRQGRIVGVLSVGASTASVIPFAERSERKVYRAGLVLMGAALLMGLGMTFWLTRSLRRLQGYARRVAEGEKATPPALGGELAELGRSLEVMREKLEGRHYVERYVHALTHEMKSPLAAIHGSVELLEEGVPEAERRRFLANIREQDERLQRLVERMLSLATLEKRQVIENPQRLSLSELVRRVCQHLGSRAAHRGIALQAELPEEAWVVGDPLLLELALSNLLDNALDFSPEGAEVCLGVKAEGSSYVLWVRDRGPGIPDYALGRVFEPFYSLPRPGTGKKSTGLGLRFVQEIALLHGGGADLRNLEGGGAEARFWVHARFT